MNKKKSLKNVLIIIVVVALALLALTFGVIYLLGFRYIREKGNVRYFGKTAYEQPISGTLYYSDKLKGKIKKDKDSAICVIKYSNGDVYEGELLGIKRNGNGKLVFGETKDVYEGSFKDDEITGEGTYTYKNGDLYEGSFEDGMKNGHGKFTWSDGSYYYGDFKDNMRHGVGEYRLSDGTLYIGEFVKDKRNGSADVTVVLLSGETYSGKNTLKFNNGDVYTGAFVNGSRTGSGEYVWATGERYVGEFTDGVMNGKGIYYRTGGLAPYDGYFENGNISVVENESAAE